VSGPLRIDRIAPHVGGLQIDAEPVFERCYVADSFVSRLVGVLGTRRLEEDEALVIPRCAAVHTLGMRTSIDVVFLDGRSRVIGVNAALRPFRAARGPGARLAVETAAGAFPWRIGQRVSVRLL